MDKQAPKGYDAVCEVCDQPFTFQNAQHSGAKAWQSICSVLCESRRPDAVEAAPLPAAREEVLEKVEDALVQAQFAGWAVFTNAEKAAQQEALSALRSLRHQPAHPLPAAPGEQP
jgi:hypothetical protein